MNKQNNLQHIQFWYFVFLTFNGIVRLPMMLCTIQFIFALSNFVFKLTYNLFNSFLQFIHINFCFKVFHSILRLFNANFLLCSTIIFKFWQFSFLLLLDIMFECVLNKFMNAYMGQKEQEGNFSFLCPIFF